MGDTKNENIGEMGIPERTLRRIRETREELEESIVRKAKERVRKGVGVVNRANAAERSRKT